MTAADELRWLYASVHSLFAAMARQGERQAAEALQRISLLAAKLAGERGDTWTRIDRGEPRGPREPSPAAPSKISGDSVPLSSLLPHRPVRP